MAISGGMNKKDNRKSNFELLRLVAMFFILLYHLLSFFVIKIDDNSLYKAVCFPLHTAVICFVLISGYFHIKPTLRGVVRLVGPLLLFYFPLSLCEYATGMGNLRSLMFFSQSPYWFVRVYFYLFLLSPIVNLYLTTSNRRLYLLLVTGILSMYMGTVKEPSMIEGKNVVLFIFIYSIGDWIRAHKKFFDTITLSKIIVLYVILNGGLIALYANNVETFLGKVLWVLSFPYCSPLLIFNAILLFLLFSKVNFKSNLINWLSSSVFSVYILHHQHFILFYIIMPIVLKIYAYFHMPLLVTFVCALFALALLMIFILVDKLFTPAWTFFGKEAAKIDADIREKFCIN